MNMLVEKLHLAILYLALILKALSFWMVVTPQPLGLSVLIKCFNARDYKQWNMLIWGVTGLKSLTGKEWFKYHGYGHFQVDYPNWRTLTAKDVEELKAIEVEICEDEFENKEHTLVTMDVEKLLVIQRALHVKEVTYEPN